MRYFTKDLYKKMQVSGFLTFPETKIEWDEEIELYKTEGLDFKKIYEDSVISIKEDLLTFLPSSIYPYINNGKIKSEYPSEYLKIEIEKWVKEFEEEVNLIEKQYNKQYNSIKHKLPQNIIQISEISLHDSVVESIESIDENSIVMTLNSENTVDYRGQVRLRFNGIKYICSYADLENACWVYNEVYITDNGFELNILFDCPLYEFKIIAEDILIEQLEN